jgi:hypothetical protein
MMNRAEIISSARSFRLDLIAFFLGTTMLISPLSVFGQSAPATGVSLIGTIISKSFKGAVIKDSKGEQTLYLIHDKLPDGSQLVKIYTDSISLKGPDNTAYTMYILHDKTTVSPDQPLAEIQPSKTTVQSSSPTRINPRNRGRRSQPEE